MNDMITIELTPEEGKALLGYLDRVEVKGLQQVVNLGVIATKINATINSFNAKEPTPT